MSDVAIRGVEARAGGTTRRRAASAGWLAAPPFAFLALALLLPVGYLMAQSFKPALPGAIGLDGETTLANYARFVSQPFYYGTLIKTVWVAGLTTLITALIGFALALVIWTAPPRRRGFWMLVALSPLLVNIVTRTYGWMILLGDRGLINRVLMATGLTEAPVPMMYTSGAVIVGLVHVFLPFMALCILTSLDKIDPMVPEAARTLGASAATILREILLPLSIPGLASGITIVFSLAISSYVTPALMGGSRSGMLTTFIYQQFAVTFDWRFGAVLVTMLLGVTLVTLGAILAISGRLTRDWRRA